MTAKEYLKSIKRLDAQIQAKDLEIKDIQNRMTGCQAISYEPKLGTGSPSTESPQEKFYPILEQYQKELQEQIKELVDYKATALKILDQIQEATHIAILYKRYFEYKQWEEIAVEMHYSYRGILKMHGRALQDFDAKLKECTQVHIQK